jgi:hypothetical protein
MILSDVQIMKKGMKMDAIPQHSSMKKCAVASPKVPIQLCAFSPSTQVESSITVKGCDKMLKKTKALIRKIIAPTQNLVISALGMPSGLFESAADSLIRKKLRTLPKNPVFFSSICFALLFLLVFLSFLLFAI